MRTTARKRITPRGAAVVPGMLPIWYATAWWLGYGRCQIHKTIAGSAQFARGYIPVPWTDQTHAIKTTAQPGGLKFVARASVQISKIIALIILEYL